MVYTCPKCKVPASHVLDSKKRYMVYIWFSCPNGCFECGRTIDEVEYSEESESDIEIKLNVQPEEYLN